MGVRVHRWDVGSQASRAPEEPFQIHTTTTDTHPPLHPHSHLTCSPRLRGKGMCFELCWLPGSIPPEGMEILSGGGGAGGEGELRENSKSSGSRCGGLSAAMGGGHLWDL